MENEMILSFITCMHALHLLMFSHQCKRALMSTLGVTNIYIASTLYRIVYLTYVRKQEIKPPLACESCSLSLLFFFFFLFNLKSVFGFYLLYRSLLIYWLNYFVRQWQLDCKRQVAPSLFEEVVVNLAGSISDVECHASHGTCFWQRLSGLNDR